MEENTEELKRCKEFGRKQLMGKISPTLLQIKEGIQKTDVRLLDESHVMSFLVHFDPLLLGLNNYGL